MRTLQGKPCKRESPAMSGGFMDADPAGEAMRKGCPSISGGIRYADSAGDAMRKGGLQ